MSYTLHIEKRIDNYPRWFPALVSVGAVIAAFVLSGIILKVIGGHPIKVMGSFFQATFGSLPIFADTLVKATPLILVGLACTLAFKMKLWNIGAEGQFYIGAWFASTIVMIPLLPATTPRIILIPVMMLAALFGGALYGFIPGYLKARFAVNEIITTLMLNYVAIQWNNYWIFDRWSDQGFQMTPTFIKAAWLPRLADYARAIPFFSGITLHLGVLVGVVAAVLIWWIFKYSRWGYEIKLIGDNPQAARYAGINIARNVTLVMMLSGALAGLAGMVEITGVVHRLQEQISPGYGFSGIIVAWLAKLNPFAVILVSVLFGALIIAGREIQPVGLSNMLQGFILFFVISSDVLLRYKISVIRTSSEAVA